jgi:hypothetical protein
MVAPSFAAIGTQQATSTANPSVEPPAGLDDEIPGQVVVVTMLVDGTATVTGIPAGFTRCDGFPLAITVGGGAHRQEKFWGHAADVGAGPWVWTLSGGTYVNRAAELFVDCRPTGNPWDADFAGQETSGVNGTVTPALEIETSSDDCCLVFSATNWSGGAWTPPTGFTERRDSGDRNVTSADKTQASAGLTGSVTATCAGNDKRTAWLGALLPVVDEDPPVETEGTAPATATATAVRSTTRTTTGRPTAAATATAARATARVTTGAARAVAAASAAVSTARTRATAAIALAGVAFSRSTARTTTGTARALATATATTGIVPPEEHDSAGTAYATAAASAARSTTRVTTGVARALATATAVQVRGGGGPRLATVSRPVRLTSVARPSVISTSTRG